MLRARCSALLRAALRSPPAPAAAPCGPRSISTLTTKVTDDLRNAFERDGAVCVRGAFGADWIETMRAVAERNLQHPGPLCDEHVEPGKPGRFHDDQFLWLRHEEAKRFVFDSQAAALVQAITGSSGMHIFYDQLFVKEPGTNKETKWHTDHSYWQLRQGKVATVWLALDVVPKNTVVGYVAGSHKWHLSHQITSFSGDQSRYAATAALPPVPDVSALEAKGEVQVLRWDLEPGDCVVFDSFSVHGSPGNSSNSNRRRAYATRWANSEVRFDAKPGTMHFDWKERGGAQLDCGLADGAALTSKLHPLVPAAL